MTQEPQSSRIIVKGLGKHVTEDRIRSHFAEFGEVTDVKKIMKNGTFRGFAFVGFRQPKSASLAVKRANQTYFDTRKMQVEIAQAVGQVENRPWSKYAHGSSQHRKMYPEQYAHEEQRNEMEKRNNKGKADKNDNSTPSTSSNKAMKMFVEAKTKNKSKTWANDLIHENEEVEVAANDSDDDDVADLTSTAMKNNTTAAREGSAFDDDLDDMAFLKSKATNLADAFDDSDDDDVKVAEKDLATDQQKRNRKKNVAENKKNVAVDVHSASKETQEEEEAEDGVGTTGRLYVTNLPYSCTDDDITEVFSSYGPLADCHIVRDEDQGNSRGMAYCTYVFPEHAVRALASMNGFSFQGRCIRVAPAKPRAQLEKSDDKLSKKKSYKKQKEEKMRKEASKADRTWNLLFVSANAATDALADEMGVKKNELLDASGANSDLAVRVALTETHIIATTKKWLAKEGIRSDAFERQGSTLLNASAAKGVDRSKDTIIVKHLPSNTIADEISDWFARFGSLIRFSLAPSKTVAIVQFSNPKEAEYAFGKIAFKRYKSIPMYLEYAPVDIFTNGKDNSPGDEAVDETSDTKETQEESDDESAAATNASVFVKNLSFETSDEKLARCFERLPGYRKTMIMKKKHGSTGEVLSMGYGFVEFKNQEFALKAIKKKQGLSVDGHSLHLQLSQRQAATTTSESKNTTNKKAGKLFAKKLVNSKLAIRNVPFEVNKRELNQLCSAYGTVTSVRLPKKVDGSSHRGFAFVEFLTKSEAKACMEALQHTHLYGRHLVIEPAEEDSNQSAEDVREKAAKRSLAHANSESSKRRRKNAVFQDESFSKSMKQED